MHVWARFRCTSACRFIFVLSDMVFPQVWHWYFNGPPSSTRAIIDSSNVFRSKIKVCVKIVLQLITKAIVNGQSINNEQTSSSFRIVGKFIFSGTIRPRRHNIIGMISGVVCWKSISGLEVLSTHNAGVGQVKVHLCVPLNLVLVILQAADRAPPLPLLTSFNHWLQGRVQI